MILSCLPISVFAAETEANPYYNRIVDVNTMNNWMKYFDINNLDTTNAGGVWTDKSVFTDASAFPNSVKMINDDKNFLTALSALAANKEVVGYSYRHSISPRPFRFYGKFEFGRPPYRCG